MRKIGFLMLCEDIESNPGPGRNSDQNVSICHWNLNSIATHNFSKNSLLKAYNALVTYDIMCLSGMYLNRDNNLRTLGYKLIRADHPSNQKQDGVCKYLKDSLQNK